MDNIKELAKQVLEVRKAQKLYFASRTRKNLEDSKRKERELDHTVNEILNIQPENQTTLF